MSSDSNSTDYIKGICQSGGEVYVVGGAIRNYVYNCLHKAQQKIKDYDYLVRLIDIEKLITILKKYGTVKEVGKSFGVILLNPFGTNENIEFALPRTEKSIGYGYKDFIIVTDHMLPILKDFARRDATINAIGMKICSLEDLTKLDAQLHPRVSIDQFIDPFGGIIDIKFKFWKCVGNASKRFAEDPTRIMRAFRQASELDFTIDTTTMEAIARDYVLLKSLIPQSYVRLYNELLKTLMASHNKKHLEKMNEFGIFKLLGIENYNKCTTNMLCKKSINRTNGNLPIIKLALLTRPENMHFSETNKKNYETIKTWAHVRQLSATNYLTSDDINVLLAIRNYYFDLKDVNTLNDFLVLRKNVHALVKIQSNDVVSCMITYLELSNCVPDDFILRLNLFLEQAHTFPCSINQLKLTGDDIMTLLKCSGQMVGKIKEKLLDLVLLENLKNTKADLKEFVLLNGNNF